MAEPAAREDDGIQAASHHSPAKSNDEMTADLTTTTSTPIPASFQAINTRAVAENATSSTAQSGEVSKPTPPPKGTAVTPEATQTSSDAQASKNASQADDLDAAMANDNSTYGTRSRNRTGNARPNYAEDQDMDFELAAPTTGAHATKKKAANEPAVSGAEAKRVQEFKGLLSVNGNAPANANGAGAKESTPGSHGVASAVSKKRKATAASTALTQTPPASNSPAPAVARKATAPSAMARETNVMTFSKHRSCLNKKGELIADDGTKLCVNGKPNLHPPDTSQLFWRLRPTPLRTAHPA